MPMTALLINLMFFVGCMYLGMITIKRYFTFKSDYSHVLYWGMSFVLLGIVFLIHFIAPFVTSSDWQISLSRTISTLKLIVLLLQTYAISYLSNWCNKYGTPDCTHCVPCARKVKRSIMISIMIAVLATSQLLSLNDYYAPATIGLISMNITGDLIFDLYNNAINILLAGYIAYKLLKYKEFNVYLFNAYIFLIISRILKTVNIIFFNYSNSALGQVEWAMSATVIVVMVYEIRTMIKD